jgi:hypothetical protein
MKWSKKYLSKKKYFSEFFFDDLGFIMQKIIYAFEPKLKSFYEESIVSEIAR